EANELPGCTVGRVQERSRRIGALTQAFHQRLIDLEEVDAAFFKERIERDVPAPLIKERITVGRARAAAKIIAYLGGKLAFQKNRVGTGNQLLERFETLDQRVQMLWPPVPGSPKVGRHRQNEADHCKWHDGGKAVQPCESAGDDEDT